MAEIPAGLEPVPAARAEMERLAAAAAAEPAPERYPGPWEKTAVLNRPAIARGAGWTATVRLQHPIMVDGAELADLTLTRLTGKQLADIIMQDDGETSINLRARAAIAGVHPDVLDALEADDAVEVAEAIRPFLPRALLGAEALEMQALNMDLLAAAADAGGEG